MNRPWLTTFSRGSRGCQQVPQVRTPLRSHTPRSNCALPLSASPVHYWASLLSGNPEERDVRDIESFKRIERRIYELAGHQREIDGHFEFMRIVLRALKIDLQIETPNIGPTVGLLA